ncbi:MAG: M15 family metallopeptidase [Chitinophagaceae bacterium]|nr:M15 family metallopeptidase [Chitinophagaceae bacterium]
MIYPFFTFLFAALNHITSVPSRLEITDPEAIKTKKAFQSTVRQDPVKEMVELKSKIPDIEYDLKYATKNNFTGKRLYPSSLKKTFLRKPVCEALQQVQDSLRKKGLGLKIFDAYRPYSVTIKMWETVRDEKYVANPVKGSNHNRGTAVDLTIIHLKSRQELNMGTGFDHFSDSAHHSFTQLPEEILQNRNLLKNIMEYFGFRAYQEEWWHYSWPESERFELLDISFQKLAKWAKRNP